MDIVSVSTLSLVKYLLEPNKNLKIKSVNLLVTPLLRREFVPSFHLGPSQDATQGSYRRRYRIEKAREAKQEGKGWYW